MGRRSNLPENVTIAGVLQLEEPTRWCPWDVAIDTQPERTRNRVDSIGAPNYFPRDT